MAEQTNDIQATKKDRATLTGRVNFRCATAIKQELEERAAGHHMTLSEYLIACGLNKRMPNATLNGDEWQTLLKTLGDLGKIGSNVNQIARDSNRGQALDAAAVRALQAVEMAADALRRILLEIRKPKK